MSVDYEIGPDADLRGKDLSEANLGHCNLSGGDLRGAKLRHANLRGADLRGANLDGADLRHANLVEAKLSSASLCAANCFSADFCGANLRRADLRGASLRGADLRGADFSEAPGIIDGGEDSRGYRIVAVRHDDGWYIAAGCRWLALDDAVAHWGADSRRSSRECLVRVRMLRRVIALREGDQ